MNCIDLTSERSKYWVTSQNIQNNAKLQSDQITMNCIDLMSKRLKQRKITNAIKLWSICIDLTSKLSKMLSYVSKNSKERKTTKLIKDKKTLSYVAKHSNNAKLQNWSNNNALHRFDVKTIKTFELGGKIQK